MIICTNREGTGQRLVLNLPGSPRAAYRLDQDKPTPAFVTFGKTDFPLDCRNKVREAFHGTYTYTKLNCSTHTNCLSYQKTINPIGTLPGLLEQNSLDLGRILVYLHLYHTLILHKMDGVIIILRERLVNLEKHL